jgi:polysaccharide biosynthesis/export protein
MKKNNILIYIFISLGLFSFLSCRQTKNVAYYQNIDSFSGAQKNTLFESTVQPDDLLMITVSAADPEAAAPFNLTSTMTPTINGQSSQGPMQQQLYLVNSLGVIQFPVLGEIKIGGLTKNDVNKVINDKLKKYLKDAIVNIRIMNFKVSILGEVNRPGSFNIASERITLPEALSLAGDLTIFGKRNNVILVRELDGKRSYNRVDLTKADFINSSFYYLSQNDLIYVEPNNAKSNTSSVFNQNIPILISLASLISSAVFSILLINKN